MPIWSRRGLFVLAGLATALAAFQLYSVWPARFDVRPVGLPTGSRAAALIFHGSGGRDEPVLVALESRLREVSAPDDGIVVRYPWSPQSDARLRTYANGTRVGEQLGAELARLPRLQALHLIAHSAGSYILDPLCESYRAAVAASGGRAARVRMTFLDPIGFKGPFDPGWGSRHYGRCADDAEAFINADDPVPATARVLQQARTIDVTTDPLRKVFNGDGHRWPVQYFSNSLVAPTARTDSSTASYNGAHEQ